VSESILTITQRDTDKIKAMPRKELNAECLHLMREQVELAQQLHDSKKRMAMLERVVEAVKNFQMYRGTVVEVDCERELDAALEVLEV